MSDPRRVHDLTARLETHMPVWATSPLPVFEPVGIVARDGYAIEKIACMTHTGTHVDAPYHFLEDGLTVDRIPPEKLVGSAAVLDLRGEIQGDRIPVPALSKHWPSGPVPDMVFLHTGWSDIRAPTRKYLYEFPGIDPDGAKWLAERGIHAVGTDALGIDPYSNSKFEAHKTLLGKGVYIIEAMAHLSELKEGQRYTAFVGPLKIAGASGAMARVLAVE